MNTGNGHFRTCQCLGQVQVNRGEITVAEEQGTGGAGARGCREGDLESAPEPISSWLQTAKAAIPNGVWRADFTHLEHAANTVIKT